MGKTYLVTTFNLKYNGKVAGITFKEGQAILNEEIAKTTNRTLDQLLETFTHLGYSVTEQEVEPVVEEPKEEVWFTCAVEGCGRRFKSKAAIGGHMKGHRYEEKRRSK